MPLISITGTPGTGKTSVSQELRSRGYSVLDVNKHLRDNSLLGEKDLPRDTFEVDVDTLNDSLEQYRDDGLLFMDSHLSHLVDFDKAIVLRCSPKVLADRLHSRGYSDAKVTENVQAEILDVILCEAMDGPGDVFELDCSSCDVSETVDSIVEIINGNGYGYAPGKIDWSGDWEEWF